MTIPEPDTTTSPASRVRLVAVIVLGILAGLSLGHVLGRLGPGPASDPIGRRWGVPAYRVSDVGIPGEIGR